MDSNTIYEHNSYSVRLPLQ